MTANAMKGDDLKFKEAGMNDVVFKPFQASELYKAIIRNIELVSIEIISNEIKNNLIKKEDSQIEFTLKHASLHVLKSFSRGKDSFIVKMLKVLLESVPPTAQELEKAIASQDWISVTKFSHKLIPNMNMMGNALLEMEMKWIEDVSKEPENDVKSEINSRWPKVKKELEQTLSDLEKAEIYYKSKETSVNQ